MALTPALKYPGGKSYLARKIVERFPSRDSWLHYVEPYFGGGAVLFENDPEGISEVINDVDRELTCFWRVLQHGPWFEEFSRRAQAIPFSQIEWEETDDNTPERTVVDRALQFFIRSRQSLAGRKDSFAPLSKTRTRRGMNEQASAWLGAVDGLRAVHERLRRVVILNQDALDVIRSQDGPETLFYLDPPYLHETRRSKTEYGAFEMSRMDHVRLLVTLSGIEGRFLLSGYPSELYAEAERRYGWVRHEFDLANHAAGGRSKRRMTECLWANFWA